MAFDPQTPQGVVATLSDLDYGIAGSERLAYTTAFLNATASGNTQLVAASAGRRIRVIWIVVTNKDASVVAFKLQSATTDITSTHDLAADGGGYAMNAHPAFYCQTAVGEALNANLGGVSSVGVDIGYVLV